MISRVSGKWKHYRVFRAGYKALIFQSTCFFILGHFFLNPYPSHSSYLRVLLSHRDLNSPSLPKMANPAPATTVGLSEARSTQLNRLVIRHGFKEAHIAVLSNDVEKLKALPLSEVNTKTADSMTPLHIATLIGSREVFCILIDKGASFPDRIDPPPRLRRVDWQPFMRSELSRKLIRNRVYSKFSFDGKANISISIASYLLTWYIWY